jgi:hypothetical protein
MPEPSSIPQPSRPRRFWLWAPYVALLAAVVAWTGVWWTMKTRVETALADQAARLRAQGYAVSWSGLKVAGWPFRLDVTLIQPRLAEPSGWALSAPRLDGEGMAYAPDHWIAAAPLGLTLTRPGKGPLSVTGRAIRASVGALGSDRPRFSFEGLDLTFSPLPGGQAAPFTSADRLELHLQPGPGDQGAFLVRLEGASLTVGSAVAGLVPLGVFGLTWDSRLSHLSALRGPNWPAVLQAWTAAGGAMTVVQGEITLGPVGLRGAGGPLTVGPDGRLRGAVPLTLDPGKARGLGALLSAGPISLTFKDGHAAIGPLDLGPALKVW